MNANLFLTSKLWKHTDGYLRICSTDRAHFFVITQYTGHHGPVLYSRSIDG